MSLDFFFLLLSCLPSLFRREGESEMPLPSRSSCLLRLRVLFLAPSRRYAPRPRFLHSASSLLQTPCEDLSSSVWQDSNLQCKGPDDPRLPAMVLQPICFPAGDGGEERKNTRHAAGET
ncbi:hypothetical protein K456DRAFT_1190870 [Colletotrichum gloeosporioides 23]|nr:hypothetical protein K456DRAFT_1190870 [Colletotrichum gloeosporioides 23]